jgi:hypothetical protein
LYFVTESCQCLCRFVPLQCDFSICRSKDTEVESRIDAIENGSSNEIP